VLFDGKEDELAEQAERDLRREEVKHDDSNNEKELSV
jgi:hypothetical protein